MFKCCFAPRGARIGEFPALTEPHLVPKLQIAQEGGQRGESERERVTEESGVQATGSGPIAPKACPVPPEGGG